MLIPERLQARAQERHHHCVVKYEAFVIFDGSVPYWLDDELRFERTLQRFVYPSFET
jgi:hypothetical protein